MAIAHKLTSSSEEYAILTGWSCSPVADGRGLGLEVSGRVGPGDRAACCNRGISSDTISHEDIRECDGPSNEILKVLEEIELLELSHVRVDEWRIDGASGEVLVWVHSTVVSELFERVVLLTDTIAGSCAPGWGVRLGRSDDSHEVCKNTKLVDREVEVSSCHWNWSRLLDESRFVRELHELKRHEHSWVEYVAVQRVDPRATVGKGWLTSSSLEGDLSGRELLALGWVVPGRVVDGFAGVDGAMWVPWVGMLVGLRV